MLDEGNIPSGLGAAPQRQLRHAATTSPASAPASDALRTDALDYHLPAGLIATRPVEPRDSARMMVVSRSDPSRLEHRHARDLPELLRPDDALVFNTSAVARARLAGRRLGRGIGGRIEGLFLSDSEPKTQNAELSLWLVLLRSNGRLREGDRLGLVDRAGGETGVVLELRERRGAEWIVAVDPPGDASELLERIGRTPLPPYILKARGREEIADELDRRWYETVYADRSPQRTRSVAAPTAGLHFTPELLDRLDARGVRRLNVVLHVGAGTFKPVTAATLAEHTMHSEWYEIPPATLQAVRRGPRIIAIGTTAVRALESVPDRLPENGIALRGSTDLMIAPGHTFRHVDGMLTNFHLPRSTLMALIAAMIGLDRLKALYAEAVARRYRFYSYGDCMLILP